METYLPSQQEQRLPALLGVKVGKGFDSEREILYQVLFDMRQDVTELKRLVHEIMSERGAGSTAVPASNAAFYSPSVVTPPQSGSTINIVHPLVKQQDDDIQDTEEYIEESLSLDDLEKELIRKALDKHHGKRKNAAKDLNISERTLYRKIKEYGLD